ncbi:unnamed protein product, partial [Rotaria sp. Silwood1]
MNNLASTTTAESGQAATTTNSTAVLPTDFNRVLQNFLLIWLDANFNESREYLQKSIQCLRRVIASIRTFTDAELCVNFLREVKEEKTFMIVSESLGRRIIPDIQAWSQLDSVYVLCDDKSVHEQWVKTISKIKGVYTNIEDICKVLQSDCANCDRAMIPLSFKDIDPLFMYTQLLKEILLEMKEDDAKSFKELIEFCGRQKDIDKAQIDEFAQKYSSHPPIWWYTYDSFIYGMLNRGLRRMEVDIMLKMAFFIRALHKDIETLHLQQQSNNTARTTIFHVFRGQ